MFLQDYMQQRTVFSRQWIVFRNNNNVSVTTNSVLDREQCQCSRQIPNVTSNHATSIFQHVGKINPAVSSKIVATNHGATSPFKHAVKNKPHGKFGSCRDKLWCHFSMARNNFYRVSTSSENKSRTSTITSSRHARTIFTTTIGKSASFTKTISRRPLPLQHDSTSPDKFTECSVKQ